MKYNEDKFYDAVKEYSQAIGNIRDKTLLVVLDLNNKDAYYSLAPLSRAVHNRGGDLHIIVNGKNPHKLDVLNTVWRVYQRYKQGKRGKREKALIEFIRYADKKTEGDFESIFEPPELRIRATKEGFIGSFNLDFKAEWFKPYRWEDLRETGRIIWDQVFDLKKKETVGIGFELIPTKKQLGHPLEDYLDSFPIARAMALTAKSIAKNVNMGSSSSRYSQLARAEKITDLTSTILGCEFSKKIEEPVFRRYRKVSRLLKLDRMKLGQATFAISGKGYPGKHLFGETIGYPSPDRKTRWNYSGQIVYKLDFYPQTKIDKRDPIARVAFTETLPIDVFIQTCNIDWFKMHNRNHKIISIIEKSDKVIVNGNKIKGFKTELEVGLIRPDGTHRWARSSGIETREIINKDYFEKTGIKAGNMANLPGGEMFVTPEYVKGTVVGDVVISLDQSYRIPKDDPLIIECYGDSYKIKGGPRWLINRLNKKKQESWKKILYQEQQKSLPKEVIDLKKSNFNGIGEFAINTHPKAKLCDYLIVNEKIAKMIHIALGSGFEPDKATEYHTDIVIDSPRQKLDIYGIDSKGKERWIIKKGKFVV